MIIDDDDDDEGSSNSNEEPNPRPNEDPTAPTPIDPGTTTPETPSSDASGSTNDRASGGLETSSPFGLSNNSDQGTPYSIFNDDQGSRYHLIDPGGLSALSDIGDLRADASAFYHPSSAFFLLLFGADKPSDLIPNIDSFKYGVIGGGISAFVTLVGLAFTGQVEGAPAIGESFELGFELGSQAHEFVDEIMTRASAINSLSNDIWADPNPSEPTPAPGPTPGRSSDFVILPDMTPPQRLK